LKQARYIMIGGFLGAGKTTAILRVAERFRAQGLRVGLITNDQSVGLVDTAMLGAHGFPVEEITGGCFCCKFGSLVDAADRLAADGRPDVFLAEPVGSCTDLKATVDYPLRRMYGESYSVAPFSVLVDPLRARRILALDPGRSFSPKVEYIYRKQLEEADLIVINKIDLLTDGPLAELTARLRRDFPQAEVVSISARNELGLEPWLVRLTQSAGTAAEAMEVDYDLYAEGEALLGWVNCTARLAGAEEFDGNRLLTDMAVTLQSHLRAKGVEVGHLKLTLTPEQGGSDIGVVNAVRSDQSPEQSHSLHESLDAGELILNLRAEADPEYLRTLVAGTLDGMPGERQVSAEILHLEAFRPGRPVPTHRLTAV
jgi:G3E family GTPase